MRAKSENSDEEEEKEKGGEECKFVYEREFFKKHKSTI